MDGGIAFILFVYKSSVFYWDYVMIMKMDDFNIR